MSGPRRAVDAPACGGKPAMNDSGVTRGQLVSRLTEYRQTPDSNNPPEPETIRAARSAALARRSRSRAAPPESFIAGASPLLRGMAHSCVGLQGRAVVDRPINHARMRICRPGKAKKSQVQPPSTPAFAGVTTHAF